MMMVRHQQKYLSFNFQGNERKYLLNIKLETAVQMNEINKPKPALYNNSRAPNVAPIVGKKINDRTSLAYSSHIKID
jgi:hypothetical protein